MTKKSERTKKDGNKIKLLRMMELLRSSATEKHPLTMEDITAELKKHGIMCERRTFGNDMKLLMETFHVKKTKVGRKNGYYILSRALNDTEIKMLIDTVQAASFLSDSMTEFFVKKLSRIGYGNSARAVFHFRDRMILSLTGDLFLIDHGIRYVIAQPKANSAAASRIDKVIHGPGVKGIFPVHELRMQHHGPLLGRMEGL